MNILLTGGAGYIGSHAVLSLIDNGHSVTVIDNLITGSKKLIPSQVKYYECDIADIHTAAANALFKNSVSDIYNCGYGQGYSVKQVVTEMENIINDKLKVEIGPRREKDISVSIANSDKFKKKFNWKLKFNNLNYISKTALEWEKIN